LRKKGRQQGEGALSKIFLKNQKLKNQNKKYQYDKLNINKIKRKSINIVAKNKQISGRE